MSVRFARLGVLASTLAAGVVGFELSALRAAGLNGTPPPHAAEFKAMISTLTDNWTWLVGSGIGLVLVLLSGC